MANTTSNRSAGNAALEKGLTIFTRIARDRGQTKLPALMHDMMLPRATLYRLAGTLEHSGLITRISPGRYTIALPLIENLQGISQGSQLAAICRPALLKLAKSCNATAHLGVLENDMVTYLVKARGGGDSKAAAFTRENSQLEAYCSGIGKVLLAWLPDDERETYLSAGNFVALTKKTVTDPTLLRDCLKTTRQRHWASDDGEIQDDLYCLAVPLWTDRLPMTAAISLSLSRPHLGPRDRDIYLKKLRLCAAVLEAKLGKYREQN